MALTIPPWLMGWDVTSVTARYQVANSSGVLGNGSSAVRTLTGVIDAIEYSGEDTEEEISPLTSRYENTVAIAINDRLRLVEIMGNNVNYNFLAGLKNNGESGGEYLLFTLARSGNSIQYVGTMGELRESVRQGKSVLTLEVAFADVFDDTPTPDEPEPNPVYT